jgi:1-acyl-sn-glycerol-3-phosphate acyltransferase
MAALRTALFLLVANLLTGVMMIIGLPLALASRGTLARLAKVWAWSLLRLARGLLGVRWTVEGIVPQGPTLIAAKHESAWETLALLAFVDDPVVVLKRQLADVPLFGWLTRRHGVIPVDRTANASALRAMLSAADEARVQDRAVLIFPEGTRVPHGETPRLQAGFAGLYARLALPVVPVATDAGTVWRRSFAKRPGMIRLRFTDPIPPGLPRKEVEARVHEAINELNATPAL